MRFGTIALAGRSNVGKSTLLNRLLGEPLAIVSPLPQTTREALLGVVHSPSAQLAVLDTPGLHKPKSELGRRMNAAAWDATAQADVVVFVTDLGLRTAFRPVPVLGAWKEDRNLLRNLRQAPGAKAVLVVNKVDLLKDKSRLLPLLQAYSEAYPFTALLPVSALTEDGIERVLSAIVELLPEGPAAYDSDTLTDRSIAYFTREYIREQVLEHTRGEVPHAVAVTLDEFEEQAEQVQIRATIHVEKVGQRKIIIGEGGNGIGQIRIGTVTRLGKLLGRRVRLELFVRITPRWKNVPRMLAEFGYDLAQGLSYLPRPQGSPFSGGLT